MITARQGAARTTAAMVLLALWLPAWATAGPADPRAPLTADADWRLATSLGVGAVSPDPGLSDFRWDTRPAALYSLQAVALRGPLGLGLRYSRWATTQGTGLATVADPGLRVDDAALIAGWRVWRPAGFQLWGSLAAGRVAISYNPDRVSIPSGVPGEEVTVSYDRLGEWNLGLGIAVQREIGRQWAAALAADWSRFALDASHRRGAEIVTSRTGFASWSVRLQISWLIALG